MSRPLALGLALLLAGCGTLDLPFFGGRDAPASASQSPGSDTPRPSARPDEAETPAAGAATVAPGVLGTTLATLGDATVGGMWLETPLVEARTAGRVTARSGSAVEVTLIPSGGISGSGSRISLPAMQALGLPLTAVAELTVEAL